MYRGFIGLGVVLLAMSTALRAQQPVKDDARALEDHVRKVVAQAEPAVVAVIVSHAKYPRLPTDGPPRPGRLGKYLDPPDNQGVNRFGPKDTGYDPKLDLSDPQNVADNLFGSGLVLDSSGLILTPYHLIEGATKIYVRTSTGKGSYADFHAYDARSDLAVLKLIEPPAGMKEIRLGDVRVSDGPNGEKPTVARGMFVLSMGHAQAAGAADGSASVSFGVLSNVRRRAAGPSREEQRTRTLPHYGMVLHTDARVTLGCSGGALLNLEGELIGITTPMAAVTGAETSGGFALPIDANYRRILDVLKAGKEVEYGFLGVTFSREIGHTRLDNGLKIDKVTPGAPAYNAGLLGSTTPTRGGDSIVAIDGNPIKEQDDLFLYVGAALAGTQVKMTVSRPQSPLLDVKVTLAKFDHPLPWLATNKSPDFLGLRIDYSSVMLLKANLADTGIPAGVAVREVDPGSVAAEKFKALPEPVTRWLITHVNGKAITNPTEYYGEIRGKDSIRLRLLDPSSSGADRNREITIP